MNQDKKTGFRPVRWWALLAYDTVPLLLASIFILLISPSHEGTVADWATFSYQLALAALCLYTVRAALGVYRVVWRFADTYSYIRLMEADFLAGVIFYAVDLCLYKLFPELYGAHLQLTTFLVKMSILTLNLLACLCMRLLYQFLYQHSSRDSRMGKLMRVCMEVFFGIKINPADPTDLRIKIAVVGAGRVGTSLAEELLGNRNAPYVPVCFIDRNPDKIGRRIYELPVLSDEQATKEQLQSLLVQEIVFALPRNDTDKLQRLYEYYSQTGCKVKIYDYPLAHTTDSGKRHLREFDIQDLLFRQERVFTDEATVSYYEDRVVLISGGGGSIGSELCRQIAKMNPRKLVILDVYENGAYDIQQELRIAYGKKLELQVEIASVCDAAELDKIFARHKPQVVIHAAAHKHVPLMEHNCCEAVRNNVFGTLNIVEAAEKHGVKKFIMVSTDKAVNPTNIMGATKRMCEMIVLSRKGTQTEFSATRFGNVLGSNGSVIPLFKRQIAAGGPVTVTDKRIIRYFMTIPEASQLVLQSGAMAKNGELFVLDMGKPVKILDLAENMIRLSGFEPYRDIDIVETGLREGEKLYEELLIRTEELDKTDNAMIFIERDAPLCPDAIAEKLELLRAALQTGSDEGVRSAMKQAVPTYRTPEEVNAQAQKAREMALAN